MSKEKNEGEKLVEDLHKLKKQPLKEKAQDAWTFTKFLVGFTFAAAIAFLGAYAILKGVHEQALLRRYAFTVSGACAVVQSLYLMWVQVIKKA